MSSHYGWYKQPLFFVSDVGSSVPELPKCTHDCILTFMLKKNQQLKACLIKLLSPAFYMNMRQDTLEDKSQGVKI